MLHAVILKPSREYDVVPLSLAKVYPAVAMQVPVAYAHPVTPDYLYVHEVPFRGHRSKEGFVEFADGLAKELVKHVCTLNPHVKLALFGFTSLAPSYRKRHRCGELVAGDCKRTNDVFEAISLGVSNFGRYTLVFGNRTAVLVANFIRNEFLL